ncbi:MAG: hypothetical protein ABI645_08655 [Pseudomonadota bacterium]
MVISRRAVLNGFGQSATLGALAAALPTQLRAAEAASAAGAAAPAATYCLTRIYLPGADLSFDGDAFRNRHLPAMIKAYGKSAERIELRLPAPVKEGAPPQKIMATVNIWFHDVNGFLKQNTSAAKDLAASMEKITKAPAAEQVDQVLTSLGDPRADVPVDCYCYSSYFPAKEGGTMDARYFAETFYPKFAAAYGNDAIRRIEVTSAATPKSLITGATHVYIRDEVAYDAAASKSPELFAELKPYTNIAPLQTLTKVYASG